MIVSHKHRYVFIELPLTGSSAIARELCELYDGERACFKHASYQDFTRWAKRGESEYFIFSGVRNPLDLVVSEYCKYKSDHKARFSSGRRVTAGRLRRYVAAHRDDTRYRYIVARDASFPAYLRRFYRLPYSSWSILSHSHLDYVYRFENLADEFETILRRIGLEPVRRLPARNITEGKKSDMLSYYSDEETIRHAKWVFGPYLKRWQYGFPPEWTDLPEAPFSDQMYWLANLFRKAYWRYLR